MRVVPLATAIGAALAMFLSCGFVMAQDQPAAGSPPSAAASQAPSSTEQAAPPAMQQGRAPNPQRQARMLARRLSLTPEQQSQVESILAARQQQMESIRADSTLTPKERRISMRGILQDTDGKIKALLNDTQKQAYERMKQEQKARRRQHREQQSGAPPSE